MSEPVYHLTRAEIQAIADEAARKALAVRLAEKPEISTAEAMQLVGCESDSAFYRWCRRAHVRRIHNGRWRRAAILRGLGAAA